jgi:ADP-dependent NAD(P)H-hydrate dehydratase / NAD(P)H-hydrate epimerase
LLKSALFPYNSNMWVLTAAEMHACDERTVAQFGMSWRELMEKAGSAVARFVLREFADVAHITVLCGKGNNGGDGLVAARKLDASGKKVSLILLAPPEQLKGDARGVYDVLPHALQESARLLAVEEDLERPAFSDCFAKTDLFIDAVFGTGFHPPLHGVAAALRDKIETLSVSVVSVDLPSGWDADSTEMHAEGSFRSDAVITFTAPKLAHVFGALTRGPVVVAEIGSPSEAIVSQTGLNWAGSSKQIVESPRALNANKGCFGHVLVVGGSSGKAGALSMASLAALRAGAGLVTSAIPRGISGVVAGFAPELMTVPLEETSDGDISRQNLEAHQREKILHGMTALAIGPGIGRETEAAEFVRELVGQSKIPLVLDADGLNAFENYTQMLSGKKSPLVLTPHPGEMARLLGCTIADVESDRIAIAREFATNHKLILVLKGWRTLIAHPDGSVAVNTSGNPALAKAGSGDVLTGIIAALIAQFPDRVGEAVECAVWLHGLAADCFVRTHDEHTMLATDILAHLSEAMRRPVEHDGFTWLQQGWR